MASGGQKPPPAVDPTKIISLENQYNHYNQTNPFGSAMWSTGPDGQQTLTQTQSPEGAAALKSAYGLANKGFTQEYVPQGIDQLTSAVLGKVGQHYGVQGMNTNLKPQGQQTPPIQGTPPMQGGLQMPMARAPMNFGQGVGGQPNTMPMNPTSLGG